MTLTAFFLVTSISAVYGWSMSEQSMPNHPHMNELCSTIQLSRRQSFKSLLAGGVLGTGVVALSSNPAHAESPTSVAESIRRSAAKVPGYGPTDIFYPNTFAGTWTMTRQVEFFGSLASLKPLTLTYPYRFIRSIEDDAVVADRGANQAELEKAIANLKDPDNSNNKSAVQSYKWEVSNPNDLLVTMSNGDSLFIKVTKRATDRGDGTVTSSEFQRVTRQDANKSVPNISARRIVTKWKQLDNNSIAGLETIYDMGGGDPMAGASAAMEPTVVSKSRLLLSR